MTYTCTRWRREGACVYRYWFFFHNKYAFCTDLIFCSVPTETKPTREYTLLASFRHSRLWPAHNSLRFFRAVYEGGGIRQPPKRSRSLDPRRPPTAINGVKSLTIQSLGRFTGRCNVRLVDASTVRDLPRTRTVFVWWHIRRSHLCPKRKLYP